MSVNLARITNNCVGLIQNNPLSSSGTNLVVDNTTDGKLNAIGSFPIYVTMWAINTTPNTDPNMEICLITVRVSPNNYTITRAQQGTVAVQHNYLDNVGVLWTKGNVAQIVPQEGITEGCIIVYDANGVPHALPPGTNGQALLAESGATYGIEWGTPPALFQGLFANGLFTKNLSDASVVQTIPHGLGYEPKNARFSATYISYSNTTLSTSFGVYNGSTQACIVTNTGTSNPYASNSTTSYTIGLYEIGNDPTTSGQTGVVTWDATNIYITWTKNGSPTGAAPIIWEAET